MAPCDVLSEMGENKRLVAVDAVALQACCVERVHVQQELPRLAADGLREALCVAAT